MGWVMRDCFICPLGKVISCVLVSWGSHQQYCKWGCQLNPSLVWLGSAGRLCAGKDRDHLVKTGTETQQMVGCILWEESFCGVGRCIAFLICLRAFWLFLAHPANTRSHFTGLLCRGCSSFSCPLLLQNSLETEVHLCIVCCCSGASDDHKLAEGRSVELTALIPCYNGAGF